MISRSFIFFIAFFVSLCTYAQFGFKKSFSSILNNNAPSISLAWSGGQSVKGQGIGLQSSELGAIAGSMNVAANTQTTTIKYELGFTHWNDRLLTSLAAKNAVRDLYIEIYGGWVWAYPVPYWKQGINATGRTAIESLINLPLKRYKDFIGTKVRFAAISHSLHAPVEYGSVDAAYTYYGGTVAAKWSFTIK